MRQPTQVVINGKLTTVVLVSAKINGKVACDMCAVNPLRRDTSCVTDNSIWTCDKEPNSFWIEDTPEGWAQLTAARMS